MKAKKIFNHLAMAMLMPAMLLTTACSNDDDAVNNDNTAKKGYPLQVTINVTRQGDEGTTRATYNESTRKLEFSAGDQLFVEGYDNTVGSFAGTLDMVSAGTFSGTIYTQNPYSGTADALLAGANRAEACLLPNGYTTYDYLHITNAGTYSANDGYTANNAFATTKATAIEQFSREIATSYSSGFALSPANAILNFTITGLTASTPVDVELTGSASLDITRSVTTDGSGNATFVVGVDVTQNGNSNKLTLTVGGNAITIGYHALIAGHIYNISRRAVALPEGALSGKFTISNNNGINTRQVHFSKGNLRAYYNTSWSWSFSPNQWDFVGNASNNTNITGNGTVDTGGFYVDLFGWSTPTTKYGIHNSMSYSDYSGSFLDWGNNLGTEWFTLKKNEWVYLFTGRTDADQKYGHGSVNSVNGLIILPDSWTLPTGLTFTAGNSAWTNSYTTEQWSQMEAAGAVFLPAAGDRWDTTVSNVGSYGSYWSSSLENPYRAYYVDFGSNKLEPQEYFVRSGGFSVRLVRVAE